MRIGDGPGEQRAGAQSPPVMMSPEMLKTILAESMAMGMQIAGASAEKQAKEQTTPGGSLSRAVQDTTGVLLQELFNGGKDDEGVPLAAGGRLMGPRPCCQC